MVGIYIRVSSARQAREGYSLQAQKERLTAYCDARGWNDYKFYIERGESAKDIDRPIYHELLNDVEKGLIKAILVYKLDRIMRSISELDTLLKFLDKYDCSFNSSTENFDTSNATGRLFMYIVGAFAQWEVDVSSERIIMVLEEKVENEGIWVGQPPYAFNVNPTTQKLEPDPVRKKIALKIVDRYLKGESASGISKYLNATTIENNWTAGKVIRVLENPAMCGHQLYKGKIYKNTHEKIIDENTYSRIVDVLKTRKLRRRSDIDVIAIFQRKLICPACKNRMTQGRYRSKRKDGSVKHFVNYKCNTCVREKKTYAPSQTVVLDALYDYMREVDFDKMRPPKIEKEPNDYELALKEIKRKRERYQKAWASDLITDDEFKKTMLETKPTYEELIEKVSNYQPPKQINTDELKGVVASFNANFKHLTDDEKREFVMMFIDKIEYEVIRERNKRPEMVISCVDFY